MRDAALFRSKILIVDDEAAMVDFIRVMLERDGYQNIQSTTDPLDAVRLFQEYRPDLVVLDVVMPYRSGLEVLADLRAIIPTDTYLPILMITGYPRLELPRDVLRLGANDFATKPFDNLEILARIENLLEILHLGRKKAEAARLENENTFFSSFGNASIGMALVSVEGRWLKVNRTLCRMLGYSESEMLTRTFQDITHPEDLTDGLVKLRQLLAGDILSYQAEKRYLHAHGHTVTILLNVSLIRDGQNQPLHFLTQIQDISERKRIEESLRLLGSAVEQSKESIVITDAQLDLPGPRILFVNPGFTEMTGYTAGEVLGKTPRILHGPRTNRSVLKRLRQHLKRGEVFTGETINYRKDGSEFVLDWQITPIRDSRGEITHFVAIQRDVTARKRAEDELFQSRETLRGILDHIPQRVFWKDRNLAYLGCNRPFAVDMGFSEPADVIGKTDLEASWKAMAGLYRTIDRSVIDLDASKCGGEEPAIAPDGRPKWIRTNRIPLHDRQGRVTGLLGTYEDITENKLAVMEIETLNATLEQRVEERTTELFAVTREAERANRAKSDFLSRTSHELRTPLNAILGFAHLLESEKNLGHEALESVDHLLQATRRLLALIDAMLDISDADSGRVSLSIQPVAVAQLVEETMCLMRRLGASCQVDLRLGVPVDGHWLVLADAGRLKQALLDLLTNAIQYSRPGDQVILDCASVHGSVPPMFRFSVKDTGPGISPENLSRLFTPFDRLDVERTRVNRAGAGLGLALARRMIELMGGRIGAESVLGEGSTFWLEVPLADGNIASSTTDLPAEFPASKTLLYIENNLSDLRLIKRMVARRPAIQLLSAGTIALGMEMARAHRPALVVLDLHLPDPNSDRALAQFCSDPRLSGIPLALLCAEDRLEMREQMRAAGARTFLTKPLDVRALLRVLDQFIPFQPEETG